MERTLAAYPLFVKDPYFSIWANHEKINENDPIYWVGNKKVMKAYIEANGEKYVFFGNGGSENKLKQTKIATEGYSTVCEFTCEEFDMQAQFLSPSFIEDIEAIARPVCYLRYRIFPKKSLKNAKVIFEAEERIAYDTSIREDRKERVRAAVLAFEKFECAYVGLERQMHLSAVNDCCGADWGYWYISGANCRVKEENGYTFISGENTICEEIKVGEEYSGFFMIGFDDVISLNYFGRPLVGYYFRNGKNICTALEEAYAEAEDTFRLAAEKYARYQSEWKKYGEDYVLLCNASLVQTIGAHKLAYDYQTNKTVFISRENGSAGCAATVDVTYPSSPLFLKYNPDLLRGMLYPIFEFAKTNVWNDKPFAPHDVGMYPLCYGEYYSLSALNNKFCEKIGEIPFGNSARQVTLPKIYMARKDENYYNTLRQMPVEESADVLIVSYAAYKADGKTEMLLENFDTLKRWADYLAVHGKNPKDQLSTDDFCGRKANNVNLAIKACFGVYAFAEILKALNAGGEKYYFNKAKEIAEYVEESGIGAECLPATFDDEKNESYSLKYNLVFDLYFQSHLFHKETFEKEALCYEKNMHRYGVKLYSDIKTNSTKSDWLAFVSCFSKRSGYKQKIFHSIVLSMKETATRVPFSDWYNVDDALPCECIFRARSVQGGIFMPLLLHEKQDFEEV